jgi:hypothetical protein
MEQVFPLLFVEQRRGWGGIQAQMPYFSGVSEVRRRSIEFLLKLDVGRLETERQRLKAEEAALHTEWRRVVGAFRERLDGEGLVAISLSENLGIGWPPENLPYLAQSRGERWVPLDSVLGELAGEQARLSALPIPTVHNVSAEAEGRLGHALEDEGRLSAAAVSIREELLRDHEAVKAVRERLGALKEDLRQHHDIATLRSLGSDEGRRLHGDCPVCHQALPESLLNDQSQLPALSPEDAVAYVKKQIELFEIMERDGLGTIEAKREHWAVLRAQAADKRSEIRALQMTLLSPEDAPSAEAIGARIRMDTQIRRLRTIQESFLGLMGELEDLAAPRGSRRRSRSSHAIGCLMRIESSCDFYTPHWYNNSEPTTSVRSRTRM